MSSVEKHLELWLEKGVLERDASERIRRFEQGRRHVRPPVRPLVVEGLSYLGSAIVAAGALILVVANWEHLNGFARVAVLAVPGAALLPIGLSLVVAREPGLRRGGNAALLLALTLVVGAVAVASDEMSATAQRTTFAAGLTSLLLAVALWKVSPSHIQVIGLVAAVALFSVGLGAEASQYVSGENAFGLAALIGLALFATGSLLSGRGVLRPDAWSGVWSVEGLAVTAFLLSVNVGSRFEGSRSGLAFGLVLLGIAIWVYAGTRPGIFVPFVLYGLISQVGIAVAAPAVAAGVGGEFASDNLAIAGFGGTLLLISLAMMLGCYWRIAVPRTTAGLLSELGIAVSAPCLAAGLAIEFAPSNAEAAVFGLTLILLAAASLALVEFNVLTPALTGKVVAAVALVAGSYAAVLPDGPPIAEMLPFLVGFGLIGLSFERASLFYMSAGIIILFVGLTAPVIRHVEDPSVAALLMMAIGLLLLAALALLARFRPWASGGSSANRWGTSLLHHR